MISRSQNGRQAWAVLGAAITLLCSIQVLQAQILSHSTTTVYDVVGNGGTSVGSYALFGAYWAGVVNILDPGTRQWSSVGLSVGGSELAATSVGPYALFGGGWNRQVVFDGVAVFSPATNQLSTRHLSQARWGLVATSVGNYAIFAGGVSGLDSNSASDMSDVVDLYNVSTDQWTTARLSQARWLSAATSVGDYAFIAGGSPAGYHDAVSTIDVFRASTGAWTTMTLPHERSRLAATSVGHFALFGGGWDNGQGISSVDILDVNTMQWSSVTLPNMGTYIAATSAGDYALFAGGWPSGAMLPTDTVNIFDATTGQWTSAKLAGARGMMAATSVGDYAVFAGGSFAGYGVQLVDIFMIPEPATLMLLGLGGLAMVRQRVRRGTAGGTR